MDSKIKMISFKGGVTKEKLYLFFVGVLPIVFGVAYGYTRSAVFLGAASITYIIYLLMYKKMVLRRGEFTDSQK